MFTKCRFTVKMFAMLAGFLVIGQSAAIRTDAAVTTTPLYLFLCAGDQDHFLTASSDEKNQLCANPSYDHYYEYEGEVWRVEVEPYGDNVPVYRFFNEVTFDHFYTINENEKNTLAETLASGKDHYVYEGIAWYAHANSGTPVYRLFNKSTFDHYYTIDVTDRDYMVSCMGYIDEGIGWYEQQTVQSSYENAGSAYNNQGYYDYSGQPGNSQGSKSDQEIVELLNNYLDQYDQHWYHSFNGEPEMDWGSFINVALFGHQTGEWYGYNNSEARQPAGDELWCFLAAAAGDGVMPIGNVYVNIYTGYVDATAVSNWNGADVPSEFWLW